MSGEKTGEAAQPVLTVTESAAGRLAEHMARNGQGKAVRIALRKGG